MLILPRIDFPINYSIFPDRISTDKISFDLHQGTLLHSEAILSALQQDFRIIYGVIMSISNHMASEHKRCDALYLAAEKAVSEGDWNTARQSYQDFCQSMEEHFAMEEKVLFPDLEQANGNAMGPTQVMRHEHEQMRSLMDSSQKALDTEDKDEFLGEAETLLVFMQQHNAKEEMMLYPMADQLLSSQGEEVISKMQSVTD